jgi:hypothetical protein
VTVTTSVTAQTIIETIPKTLSRVAAIGCGSPGLNTVWTV